MREKRSRRGPPLALALALLSATPALAFEGRVQISSAPYTITQSGSYVLTRDLSVTANQTAITVSADYVTIDLNGFAIRGPNSCSYASGAVTCSASGTGLGIGATTRRGVRVRNGTVSGTGAAGISLGPLGSVEGVVVRDTGGAGIRLEGDVNLMNTGLISDSTVRRSDDDGIRCDHACIVDGSTVTETELDGIFLRSGIARGNTVLSAGDDGLVIWGPGALIVGNSVNASWDAGIGVVIDSFAVLENTAQGNGLDGSGVGFSLGSGGLVAGNTVRANTSSGVSVIDRVLLVENMIGGNTGVGLAGGAGTCYGHNTLQNNNAGGAQVSGSDVDQQAANLCQGNATCP